MAGKNKTDSYHAWCPELNRIVTALEVWNFTFEDTEKKINKPLTFFCPVEGCNARIIVVGLSPFFMYRLHFRLYPKEKHVHPPKIRLKV